MNTTSKKLYQSVAALVGFVIYLTVITLVVKDALPLWAFAAMVAIGVILCVVFAYRTIIYCRRLKQEMDRYDKS